jgi:hypothetical protein
MVPFIEARRARLIRVLGLVVGAGLIHWSAVELAVYLSSATALKVAVYAIPGCAGALLAALLTAGVAPLRRGWPAVALASVAGLAGGAVFGITSSATSSDLWFAVDYVVWQLLVFLGLYFGNLRAPLVERNAAV